MINSFKYIFIIFPIFLFAQINVTEQDSTKVTYLIIEGDSIPRESINLDEVILLPKLKFDNKEDRVRYLILVRKTLKVYPFAKMAADKLDSLNTSLASMKRERDKRRYTKAMQKYVEGEFTADLKKLSRTEAQILSKLIHRQTGMTSFDLVKDYRNGWRAFWYNTLANMYDISLKKEFDPLNNKEDYLIEDILQRSFMNGHLEEQKSVISFNFHDLTEKWLYSTTETLSNLEKNKN